MKGGFTPFQFELTNGIKEGENTIVVKVNNQRKRMDCRPWGLTGLTTAVLHVVLYSLKQPFIY